MKSTENKRRH